MNAATVADIQIRGSPPFSVAVPEKPAHRPSGDVEASDKSASAPEPEEPPQQVDQAVEGVNAFLKSSTSHLHFALHKESQRMMVEVVDNETQEVIKTIPPKALLDLAARIEEMVGLFLDKKG